MSNVDVETQEENSSIVEGLEYFKKRGHQVANQIVGLFLNQ